MDPLGRPDIFELVLKSISPKPDSDGVHRIKNYPSNSRFTWLALGDWGGWPAPINTSPIQARDC